MILGGTHGMGLATARALLARGVRLISTGSNPENADHARRELGAAARVACSDISNLAELDTLTELVAEELGTLDALFVFAGVSELGPFEAVSEAAFDRQFSVNTRGSFFAVQRLAKLLNPGASITLTTVTTAPASRGMSVYLASKAAVRAYAQGLAAELVERRIRVNTLAPGFIDTPTLGVAGLSPREREELRKVGDQVTPMRRHGTVDEVATAALFLAFDATFTTGAELPVDGGIAQIEAPR